MARSILWISLLLITANLSAQDKTVTLRCELSNCVEDVLTLYQFRGGAFVPVQQSNQGEDTAFEFKVEASAPRFYYAGTNTKNMIPLILGTEEKVVLKGPCGSIRGARFTASKLNNDYARLKNELNQLRKESSNLVRKHGRAFGADKEAIEAQMKTVDDKKLALLDSLKTTNDFFASIVAINTYLSYQNNAGNYSNPLDHFANEYFHFVDFSQPVYNHLPWVFEAFKNYTSTLMGQRIRPEAKQAYMENALALTPKGSGAHQLALSGVATALSQKRDPLFPYFAKQFITTFKDTDPAAVASIEAELEKSKNFTVGGQAPDFTQKTPEGEDFSLSNLRGKVVLLDFWASWCGPCRRENPNVVKMYKKYHDQGFDVLGVSLDRTKDKWLKAIEADGLEWNHVSDLKGWQNAVANEYGVRSIPSTFLLDREGKIVATNLRGPALEAKLKELFE